MAAYRDVIAVVCNLHHHFAPDIILFSL